ncbi:MAG: orotate phosphoribosyltransferase [Candidatus Latescibacteria bacterium]|nr:orotate phosphoribosyltransferase [Candidatus Latescibacterota bacterium]
MDLIHALVQTQALQIAPPGDIFWYTSGTVGPYYINTHYLFGGRERAEELLAFIDADKDQFAAFPARLLERTRSRYEEDAVYRGVIDALVGYIRTQGLDQCELVSGGERRDWFFSPIVAQQLGRDHLLLYKDQAPWLWSGGQARAAGDELNGKKAVHIADLITEASSYIRSWIPGLEALQVEMACGLNVIDRAQGGMDALKEAGVLGAALLRVDEGLFADLAQMGAIDRDQEEVLIAFYRDPHQSMRQFLAQNPHCLRHALASEDQRTVARARDLVQSNPYELDVDRLLG